MVCHINWSAEAEQKDDKDKDKEEEEKKDKTEEDAEAIRGLCFLKLFWDISSSLLPQESVRKSLQCLGNTHKNFLSGLNVCIYVCH